MLLVIFLENKIHINNRYSDVSSLNSSSSKITYDKLKVVFKEGDYVTGVYINNSYDIVGTRAYTSINIRR